MIRGSGAIGSPIGTISDLLAFARTHLASGLAPSGARVLSAESTSLMQTVSHDMGTPNVPPIGYGWLLMPFGATTVLSTSGASPGGVAVLAVVPEHDFAFAAFGNDPRVVAADIPAGAKVTARALARMYAGLLGPVDGVEVVSAPRRAEATAESSSGPDQVFGNDESRWGLGFALGLPWDEAGSSPVFGMAGAGGSWAGADPDRGVAVAVTRNVMGMDFTTVERVVRAVLDAVDRG